MIQPETRKPPKQKQIGCRIKVRPENADEAAKLFDQHFFKHRLRLAKVEPGKLAMLYGTMAGYTGITRWDVKSMAGARTKVTFTESSDGPLIGLLYGNARLGNHLEQWLVALKTEAERVAR